MRDFIKSIERWDDVIERQLDLFIKNGADVNANTYELCKNKYEEDEYEDDYEDEYETNENILTYFVRHYVYYNNNNDIDIIYYLLSKGTIPDKESSSVCLNVNIACRPVSLKLDRRFNSSSFSSASG